LRVFRKKYLIALGIAVAVYALVGFLLVPRLIRSAILKNLVETFTTQPTLQRVRVNPFALSLTLEGLRVPDARGVTAVGFDKLYLRFNIFSPFFGAWTLDELRVDGPTANVAILEDRTLSLMSLMRPKPAAADTTGSPPVFLVRHLRIADGTVSYEDLSRQPEFRKALIPIQIELKDFTTRRDRRNEYSLDARTDRGETLAWSGRFTLQPFTSEGRLRIGNLQALTIEDFLGAIPPYQFTRGAIDFSADYRVDAAETPARFGLYHMGVSIRDLALADRATGEESIAAALIETKDGEIRSDLMDANLGNVSVDSLQVHVWMDSTNTTNLQRWSQAPADTGAPWTTRIVLATVGRGEVEFQERRLDPPAILQMHDVRAELKAYSSAPGTIVPMSAACSTGTGGRATAVGSLVPSTGSIDLELQLDDFDLKQIQPFVSAVARLDVTSGTVGAKGRLRWNSFGPSGPMLRFTGDVASSRFASVDHKMRQDFLNWQRLELKDLEYDQEPARIFAREIVATKPFIRFVIAPDLTSSVQAMAVPPDSVPAAFRSKPDAPDTIPAIIQMVRVVDGSMYFADLSLTPNFATGIEGLNGTIRELSSAQAAHAAIDLAGKVDEYAPVTFAGTLNPLNSRGVTDVAAKFENIELTTFTPYSGKFMGYRIEKGKLDLDLHYFIEDRMLRAENKILMRQLTLGEKVPSPDATSLPVKFAIALLKDKNGNIDLNLPIHGDLDDPKFSVFPIIMKVLVQLVVKAVTSPFKLFGAIFGGEDEEVAPAIRFPYGSAALDTTETKKLDAIRQGMADRPGLKLEIEQAGQRERDSLAVADLRFKRRLIEAGTAPGRGKPPEPPMIAAAALRSTAGLTPTEYAQALCNAYVAQFGKIPPLEKLEGKRAKDPTADPAVLAAEDRRLAAMEERVRSTIIVSPDEVSGIAVERARRIQGYLLSDTTLVAERVFIVASKDSYRPDSAGVRVGLTLTD
jgi:hypothetical protein